MNSPFLKAQHYHDEAEKLRKLAASEENEENRKSLIGIAESYDKLCLKLLDEARASVTKPPL